VFNKKTTPTTQKKTDLSSGSSVLGPTLQFIGGQLSSDEDLIIEGTVEGTVAHQSHQLMIGKTGKVKADVHARVIIIEGTLEGNIHGDEAVHIRSTACVTGDIHSPRISIEEGASFEGAIKAGQKSSKAELRQVDKKEARLGEFAGSVGVRARREP
jgi:cytoskeletal protein CcmA (bactofilin family)